MNLNLTQKKENLIEFATKVLTFKRDILNACMEKGIDPPTDKQITDYINGYDIDFESFMADYTEHEGIFIGLKTPLDDFKAEINSRSWITKPTEEEILAFFNKYGNNISLFLQKHILNDMKPLEHKVYIKTIIFLRTEGFVKLWNGFVQESGRYNTNSYIYDLSNISDKLTLNVIMTDADLKAIDNMVAQNHIRFIQWFEANDKSKAIRIKTARGIKELITTHWSEIFERIILRPYFYNGIAKYFEKIVYPIIAKEAGIEIDTETDKIKIL